jgi:uncharacterized protein YbjT (DUF2867 family)
MKVLVTGASGFVGSRLCPALEAAGHEVLAMTRHPAKYRGAGKAVRGDVADVGSLRDALKGADGVGRIVYLGGLGDDDDSLSEHLASRREVERLLGETGVPVTVLRAGIVIGHGGTSWELTRQLVEHLPAMVTPRWVGTRTQPIAIADVVRYLVGVLDHPEAEGATFDIGGPEVLAYRDMLQRVARIEGRPLVIVPVPLLSPRLSSYWLSLVTDIDLRTGRALIDSMTNEVVVRDDSIRRIVEFEPMDYDDAVLQALGERAKSRRDG